MKTIVLVEPGSTANLKIKEVSVPEIKIDEVLIKVKSISINPVDAKTRQGGGVYKYGNVSKQTELVLGWDISGVVTESKSGLFNVGDEVFGMVNFPGVGNAYAEYIAAPAEHLALKPAEISHDEAAAATLAPLTALQVFTDAGIKKGDRVLIHAASGGVGHYAVQLAKYLGAYVIGTSSATNKDFVLSLGVDEHIDYQTQTLADSTKDIDFVLDCLGPDNIINSLPVIKNGGKIISIVTQFNDALTEKLKPGNIDGKFMLVKSNGKDMHFLAKLLAEGKLKSHVSKTFSFDQMAEAHEQIESARTVGKIVVNV
ncbi:NADP-dependent oxidoreductase [Dyadobacter subterraneus]|uniref:NADP-dependent oxidoreductase n=1 Tax=Dyadobacter subterraneus TaxID=2773304 RepID=A0ABR9WEN2_9BACT|nr:NADP-dependent oxidoreductase [Dyadobacter subterraneus]MBE9463958.1 NADP-dependent oxidoreductase [Dyadobacter subterraneus]